MHVAAILGPGNLAKPLAAFQHKANAQWTSLIEQADVIVVLGGDGTIHRNLTTFVELGVPVLILPCGSGNDFARALGLRTVRDSLLAWEKFLAGANNVQSIDLGVIQPIFSQTAADTSSHYFCGVAGVGLDATITRRANTLPRWIRSRGGYGLSAPGVVLNYVIVWLRSGVRASGCG